MISTACSRCHGAPAPAATGSSPPMLGKRVVCGLSLKGQTNRLPVSTRAALPEEPQMQGVLGGLDFIYSQKSGVEEALFKGKGIGVDADIASLDFRETNLRTLKHLEGDYHVPQRFKERIGVHFAKNFDSGNMRGSVPLMLGVWGKKGCGKSFNVELCCLEMGVTPVIVSAGELEDEVAGMPGLRIRERYLQAAELMHNQGKPSCLIVNDMDAGLGRLQGAQVTVNNQTCQGTLMNLCDNPNEVSVGKTWMEGENVPRVPIIVTANDLSVLYAPLLRDGRMDKFYWEPESSELAQGNGGQRPLGIAGSNCPEMHNISLKFCHVAECQMLSPLFGVPEEDCSELIRTFPGQPLDFFGAIKSRLVDGDVREWLKSVGYAGIGDELVGDWTSRRISVDISDYSFDDMLAAGRELAAEQDAVMGSNLAREYFKRGWQTREELAAIEGEESRSSQRAREAEERWALSQQAANDAAGVRPSAGREPLMTEGGMTMSEAVKLQAEEATANEQRLAEEAEKKAAVDAAAAWRVVDPMQAKDMMDHEAYTYVDIRSSRDFNRDAFNGAVNIPCLKVLGFGPEASAEFLDSFGPAVQEKYSNSQQSKLLLVGGDEADLTQRALETLVALGYSELAMIDGGYSSWTKVFRTNGQRRVTTGWISQPEGEFDFWTASN